MGRFQVGGEREEGGGEGRYIKGRTKEDGIKLLWAGHREGGRQVGREKG